MLTVEYSSEVFALREDHKELLGEEFDAKFLTDTLGESIPGDEVFFEFMRRSSTWGFFIPIIFLDAMSDLKVEQEAEHEECNLENDPALNASGKFSSTFKGKNVPKEG